MRHEAEERKTLTATLANHGQLVSHCKRYVYTPQQGNLAIFGLDEGCIVVSGGAGLRIAGGSEDW
jgi:hypothetical protein